MTIDELAQALNQFCLERSYHKSEISGNWDEMEAYRKEAWRKAALRFLAYTSRF